VRESHGLILKIDWSDWPGTSVGRVAAARPPGCWGWRAWCLLRWGAAAARVLRLPGLTLHLILAGTRCRDGHSVVWVVWLQFGTVKSPGEGTCFVSV